MPRMRVRLSDDQIRDMAETLLQIIGSPSDVRSAGPH
jgi:hypothetical protein